MRMLARARDGNPAHSMMAHLWMYMRSCMSTKRMALQGLEEVCCACHAASKARVAAMAACAPQVCGTGRRCGMERGGMCVCPCCGVNGLLPVCRCAIGAFEFRPPGQVLPNLAQHRFKSCPIGRVQSADTWPPPRNCQKDTTKNEISENPRTSPKVDEPCCLCFRMATLTSGTPGTLSRSFGVPWLPRRKLAKIGPNTSKFALIWPSSEQISPSSNEIRWKHFQIWPNPTNERPKASPLRRNWHKFGSKTKFGRSQPSSRRACPRDGSNVDADDVSRGRSEPTPRRARVLEVLTLERQGPSVGVRAASLESAITTNTPDVNVVVAGPEHLRARPLLAHLSSHPLRSGMRRVGERRVHLACV